MRRDPTRRNRSIGTAKQGLGRKNRFAIPAGHGARRGRFYEDLREHQVSDRTVHGRLVHVVIERPVPSQTYACTVDEVVGMLEQAPAADLEGLALIVFRSTRRKENILAPTWGRWVRDAQIAGFQGPTIFLHAHDFSRPVRWPLSLTPEQQAELSRLEADGHAVTRTKRGFDVQLNQEAARRTQLYRTLPHEIGHHVDFMKNPAGFDRKPHQQKEAFAHRYAERFLLGN